MPCPALTRRVWLALPLAAAASSSEGVLRSRPRRKPRTEGVPGLLGPGAGAQPDAFVFVPELAERDFPLVLSLHGARGDGRRALDLFHAAAAERSFIVVAPRARNGTWDAIRGGFAEDAAAIDALLAYVFDRYPIDRSHVAAAGFSDGASYALSLGITNGDLFSHVIAFSPGMIVSQVQTGRPAIYVSHGKSDSVLSIETCSRRLVPKLRDAGYPVRYEEFDGPHTAPPPIRAQALDWFLGKRK